MSKRDEVSEYYGKYLKSNADLRTNACKTTGNVPIEMMNALKNIPDEIEMKYYGCGLIAPDYLNGMSIVDLGCGSGRDCYVLSQLVGKDGYVLGVDMTQESLNVAVKHVESFNEKMNGSVGRMEYVNCYLEDIQCESNKFDIAVSNCVINLCVDKKVVLQECFRILKCGGELYFSDVYCDKEVSIDAKNDKILWGDCLSGALIWTELFDVAKELGFTIPRLVESHKIEINDEKLTELVKGINFVSVTYRLFKLDKNRMINKSKIAVYSEKEKKSLKLDYFTQFQPGETKIIDGELAAFLESSRYKTLFTIKDNPDEDQEVQSIKVNPFNYVEESSKCCKSKKCC